MTEPVPPELRALPLDDAAVRAAGAACLRVAAVVEAVTVARAACLRWAQEEWRGPARYGAIGLAAAHRADSESLVARLRALGRDIENTAAHVRQQNVVRASRRVRWLADQGGG